MRCALGQREGLRRIRECVYRKTLDLDKLVCTRGPSYFRVSKARQRKSGLGLEAQQAAAAAFVASKGSDAKLLKSYVEVESGKRDDTRPKLADAMEHARLTGAVLLIAKRDRLSRDAHFLLGLQKAGVRFIAADMPEANEMVVGLMAVIAQAERKMISKRTTEALGQARKRVAKTGQKKRPDIKRLGNPNDARHLRRLGNGAAVKKMIDKAQQRAATSPQRPNPSSRKALLPPTPSLARSTLAKSRRRGAVGGRPEAS